MNVIDSKFVDVKKFLESAYLFLNYMHPNAPSRVLNDLNNKMQNLTVSFNAFSKKSLPVNLNSRYYATSILYG